MASWRPEGFGLTPETLLKITASDVDNDQLCPQHGYVKSRFGARVTGVHGWAKRWDKEEIPLKVFLIGLETYLRRRNSGSSDREAMTSSQATYRNVHGGLRTFIDHALDNYIEFLDSREKLAGTRAHYLGFDHNVRVKQRGSIAIWGAPVYEIGSGVIEVHRLRMKRTHPEVSPWAHTAAYVASKLPQRIVKSVSVLDVSLYHSSSRTKNDSVLIEGITASDAIIGYQREVSHRANLIVGGGPAKPGRDCGSCKVSGACNSLVPMDGALQQDGYGPYTRTVSATDLNLYERCPARWYMQRKVNLPEVGEFSGSDASERGRFVHLWLKEAHSRGIRCSADDMPTPRDRSSEHVAASKLDLEEYSIALPFLYAHLEHCPLGESVTLTAVDEAIYGWDATADTIIASRPDLAFHRQNNDLVIRETKTTESQITSDPDEARDAYDGIVYWLLVMASHGLVDRFGASAGIVELEILSPNGGRVFSYRCDEQILMDIAETRVRSKVEDWHEDTTWRAKPGPQCKTCPMSTWCPDNDPAHLNLDATNTSSAGTGFPF